MSGARKWAALGSLGWLVVLLVFFFRRLGAEVLTGTSILLLVAATAASLSVFVVEALRRLLRSAAAWSDQRHLLVASFTSVAMFVLLGLIVARVAMSPPRPSADAPFIGEAYYACNSPRMLEGGIYGKGPFRTFGEQQTRECAAWKAITKAEFKALGAEWFGHSWDADIPFWAEK